VVGFLLGTNIGEVITVFMAMLLWHKTPLLSMQLLWINLVTDSLPAIALGMEPIEKGIMNERPRPKDEGLFAHGLGIKVALQGCLFGTLSLIAYYIGRQTGVEHGQTLAFMVLALCQIVQAYNMRSEMSLFKIGPFKNGMLNKAALTSIVLMAAVLFIPFLRTAFGLVLLSFPQYLIGLCLIFVPLLVMELFKMLHQK
jgi:Ca2+-transporting ATPase